MTPEISVIIPTYEEWPILQLCLDCLAEQSLDQERFEVIVANNNGSPDVPDTLRMAPNVRVIHAPKPGSYAARNEAIRLARGDILFFTDSDCLPDRRWLEEGLARISQLGPYGRVAGAVQLFPKGKEWTAPELYDRVHAFNQKQFLRAGWAVTANLVVRRAAFDFVGLFDEDRFSGGDRTWNSKATKLGCKLVFSKSTLVLHPARPEYSDLVKRRKRLTGGRYNDERQGVMRKRWVFSYLFLFRPSEIGPIMRHPGLTDLQRAQVIQIGIRLGFVSFFEMIRLRYFSGKPTRS